MGAVAKATAEKKGEKQASEVVAYISKQTSESGKETKAYQLAEFHFFLLPSCHSPN